jgi:hypothetical protein
LYIGVNLEVIGLAPNVMYSNQLNEMFILVSLCYANMLICVLPSPLTLFVSNHPLLFTTSLARDMTHSCPEQLLLIADLQAIVRLEVSTPSFDTSAWKGGIECVSTKQFNHQRNFWMG